jgi:hypothetical protein
MSTTEAYPRLMHTLNEVRGQWRLYKILEGLLLTLAGLAAVLAFLVAADNLLQLGSAGRSLLALVLWGGLLASVLGLIVKRFLEDHRDDYFAALVEDKHPELHNLLINALQLGRVNQKGFSRGLVEAVVNDADRALVDLEAGDSVDRQPFRRSLVLAGLALLLVAGYAAAFTPRFTNGLARVLLPLADIAPYTRTQIRAEDVDPGTTKVPEGKPVTFTVTVQGEVPATARLHLETASGNWQLEDMHPDEKTGTFRYTIAQVGSSFDYFITAGDGRSPTFQLEAVRPPQVARLSLVYTYPSYTGLKPRRIDGADGEISGIPGTTVRLELTATKPLRQADLKTRGNEKRPEETIELAEDKGEKRATEFVLWTEEARAPAELAGKRLLSGPTTYQIHLQDSEGYHTDKERELWRSLAIKQDQPPEVVLRAPDDKMSVKADSVLPLVVDARDDFGLAEVRILFRVNNEEKPRELKRFGYADPRKSNPDLQSRDTLSWKLSDSGLKVGDRVEYWAVATDHNDITGPGRAESRKLVLEVINPLDAVKNLKTRIDDYIGELTTILKLQRQNRAETDGGVAFKGLVTRQIEIRKRTSALARAIEADHVPLSTVLSALDKLAAGPMAEVVKLLESGQGTEKEELAATFRKGSLPVQDRIIKELEEILLRLQRNEEAKKALRRLEKSDPKTHKQTVAILEDLLKNLTKTIKDQTELASKFERLPKKGPDEIKEERLKALNDLDELKKRTEKWTKGNVQEMTKLPKGFVDDFDLRKDANKVYEEIEKASERAKAEKLEVSLEDLGAGLATKMKEDLEMWMPDSPDNVKWVLEEPLNKKPMKIPEMPLPKALQDLVGELLQKADEFDEDADDVTSAWGDNLDQAGWGVSDGPISSFSAKGKTGNDQPNNMEVSGRSGDGRRGKSSGQMVGDTARALPGRKTPARVGNENFEPGKLKSEGQEDPNGATGGGKKAGAGRIGLQGGLPADMVRDQGRLSEKQAGMREKMEQLAKKLDSQGVSSTRVKEGIKLLEEADKALSDKRYEDAFKKRREAMQKLRGAFGDLDGSTAAQIHKARDLPPQLRNEMLQAADAGYPAGYESLLKSYYKALSSAEK